MRRREMLAWSVATLGTSALSAFLPSTARAGACAPPGFGPAYRTVAGQLTAPGEQGHYQVPASGPYERPAIITVDQVKNEKNIKP